MNLKVLYNKFITDYNYRKIILIKNGIFSYLLKPSGYILIIVLIVTTLLITISTEFIVESNVSIGYLNKFGNKIKAGVIARSGVDLARIILDADKRGISAEAITGKATDKKTDSYYDLWAVNFPELPIEDGSIKIIIMDENSKINLSVLSNEFVEETSYYGITQRFFLNMGLPMDLADTIIDWVDIDDASYPYGAESSNYYLSISSPYEAKNSAMDSIDEMLMIKGITPKIFYGLGGGNFGLEENLIEHNRGDNTFNIPDSKDMFELEKGITGNNTKTSESERKIGKEKSRNLTNYFTVYGKRSIYNHKFNKININTASYRVISALTEKMTDDVVTEIINKRLNNPIKNIEEIKDYIDDESFSNLKSNILSVQSYIFRISSIGKIFNTKVVINAIYNRDTGKFLYWSEE